MAPENNITPVDDELIERQCREIPGRCMSVHTMYYDARALLAASGSDDGHGIVITTILISAGTD